MLSDFGARSVPNDDATDRRTVAGRPATRSAALLAADRSRNSRRVVIS